jgi:hypothetical protein
MNDPWLAIAQALATHLAASLTSLSLASCNVDRSNMPHPRYPANPVTLLPAIFVRPYKSDMDALTNQGAKWAQTFSIWYYRKQTPGQAHGELLLADLKTIHEVLLSPYNPTAVRNAGSEFMQAVQIVAHDELSHPLGDPKLRVSVGEIVLSITARSH